jgi:hypothetical protein
MSGEAGGWMWLLLDVIAVVVLGGALAYGVMAWRRRRVADRVRDRATENLYHRKDPESRQPSPSRGGE